MTVFRITLSGKKLVMRSDGDEVICGVIKNQYVWSATEADAIEQAKRRVLFQLADNPAVHSLSDSPISLEVDEIESGVPLWKLFTNEGFVFYKIESEKGAASN